MTNQIRCHYDVLAVPRDADAGTIKKAHRKAALKHHPDKNVNKSEEEREESAMEFKLIQAAYECLSDPVERKWYDEHRDMILRGGINGGGGADAGDGSSFLYDVVPFQYAGCYDGYDDNDPGSFYSVYNEVFEQIYQGEKDGYLSEGNIDMETMSNIHLHDVHLGDSTSSWDDILAFYSSWENFSSCLSFAWEDIYHLHDIKEAPSRRIRRLMEDDNKKKRKAAKKVRVEEICALVRFVKKRDPRVKIQREKSIREQAMKEAERKKEAEQKKKEHAAAKEEWRAEAERNMAEQEAADLDAGRVRLADLSDDDYDYGGGKRRGKKKKGRKKGKGKGVTYNEYMPPDVESEIVETAAADQDEIDNDKADAIYKADAISDDDEKRVENNTTSPSTSNADGDEIDNVAVEDDLCNEVKAVDIADESDSEEESSEEEPDSWRCVCCRKEFKSAKQLENHERSKKHKEMLKKYEQKLAKEAALQDMMNDMEESE